MRLKFENCILWEKSGIDFFFEKTYSSRRDAWLDRRRKEARSSIGKEAILAHGRAGHDLARKRFRRMDAPIMISQGLDAR